MVCRRESAAARLVAFLLVMPMITDAVSHYHELLTDDELARSSLALLDAGLERSKLIFGGRRLSPYLRPHFVS